MLFLRVIASLAADLTATAVQLIGDLFVRLLKMLILPLLFFTMVSGVTKMDSPKKLRTAGGFILTYYALTSLFVATVALVLRLIIRPGLGVEGYRLNNYTKR